MAQVVFSFLVKWGKLLKINFSPSKKKKKGFGKKSLDRKGKNENSLVFSPCYIQRVTLPLRGLLQGWQWSGHSILLVFTSPHPLLQTDVAFETLPHTSFDDSMDFLNKSLGGLSLPLEMCMNLISAATPRNARFNETRSNSRSRGLLYFQCAWHDIKEMESVRAPIAFFSPPPPWFLCVDSCFGEKERSPSCGLSDHLLMCTHTQTGSTP